MEGLPSDLYNRCRSILLGCDEFQSNESLQAVFVLGGLGAYRHLIPEANRRDQRVDLCLDFLLRRRRGGEPILVLFLEALRDHYPEGDDLRNALDELAQDVRASMKQLTAKSTQEESPSRVLSPAETSLSAKSGEALELQKEFRYDAFISYSHKDSDWVYSVLLPRLEQAGLRVCIDYRDFEIGVPSLVNMENAVEISRKTLLILTPNWITSEWTTFESLLLQTQDPTNLGRRLLPLMVRHFALPNRLKIFTYLDLTKPTEFDRQMQRLLSAIQSSPPNQNSGEPTSMQQPSQPTYTATQSFVYERGLSKLGESLAQSDVETRLSFAVLESRLLTNLQDEHRYGSNETIRSERTRIVEELNRLTITYLGCSFNDLCKV
jgi:hypothetical protein